MNFDIIKKLLTCLSYLVIFLPFCTHWIEGSGFPLTVTDIRASVMFLLTKMLLPSSKEITGLKVVGQTSSHSARVGKLFSLPPHPV